MRNRRSNVLSARAARDSRRRTAHRSLAALVVLAASSAWGASATFTPLGDIAVAPGIPVQYSVIISAQTLPGFDAADIVIGSNHARDVAFAYSAVWQTAFLNVTPPTPDLGLYKQDVFVGGNNPSSVGQSLVLGIVTVDTTGMIEGSYEVRIDADLRVDQLSALVLAGVREDLSGSGTFSIVCPPADPECDNDVDLNDYRLLYPCVAGPGRTPTDQCLRYDMDGDVDVDFADVGKFVRQFSGPR